MDSMQALGALRGGHFFDAVAEAMARVGAEVISTSKPGRVTITLTLAPVRQGDIALTCNESIKESPPVASPMGAYFFLHDGQFHREDPRQAKMEFRVVDPATGEIKDVDDAPRAYKEAN